MKLDPATIEACAQWHDAQAAGCRRIGRDIQALHHEASATALRLLVLK